jgi:putative heme-binding domain-containing protein
MRIAAITCIASFLCAGAFAQSALQPQTEAQNPKTSPADIEAGKKTFHSHCSPCHGYNAEGGIGPNLAAGRFYHGSTDRDLYRNISQGIPGTEMPGIFYNGDRVWQLVAFIRSLHQPDERPSGDPARGQTIYASSGCAGCHRINGQGGSLGPDLSSVGAARSVAYLRESITTPDASVDRRYWIASLQDSAGKKVSGYVLNEDTYTVQIMDLKSQLHSYDKTSIRNFTVEKRSAMPSFRDRLTDDQLTDLVAYLWTLRPVESAQAQTKAAEATK